MPPFGGGVIGNTAGSGPVIGGSSPPPRAVRIEGFGHLAPSSSGLGRRPLKPETPVRTWSGLQPVETTASTLRFLRAVAAGVPGSHMAGNASSNLVGAASDSKPQLHAGVSSRGAGVPGNHTAGNASSNLVASIAACSWVVAARLYGDRMVRRCGRTGGTAAGATVGDSRRRASGS